MLRTSAPNRHPPCSATAPPGMAALMTSGSHDGVHTPGLAVTPTRQGLVSSPPALSSSGNREVDSSRLTVLETHLAHLESKIDNTVANVDKRLAEVSTALVEFANSNQQDLLNGSSRSGLAIVESVSSDISDLRKQVDSLQAAVDRDMLEAFRRLRQQQGDISAKVDKLMAGTQSPEFSCAPADDYSTATAPPQLSLVEVHALEARISATLVARLDSLGQQVLGFDEKMSERLARAEESVMELKTKQALSDELLVNVQACAEAADTSAAKATEAAHMVASTQAQPLENASEEPQALQLLADVDTRMTEVGQELLLLMEERFAAVEAQVLGDRTENANNLKGTREELIEMTYRISKALEERISSHDACFLAIRFEGHSGGSPKSSPSKMQPMGLTGGPSRSEQRVAKRPQSPSREEKLHSVLRKHTGGVGVGSWESELGYNVDSRWQERRPSADVETILRPSAKATDRLSENLVSPSSPGSPERQHDGQPSATGCGGTPSTVTAATAGIAAREALAALRGRLQEQSGDAATAAEDAVVAAITAARCKQSAGGPPIVNAEDAVVAAIAAARAKGSPAPSHHSVMSTFSPLAAMDRTGNSTSPGRFLHCSEIIDPDAAGGTSMHEQVPEQQPNLEEKQRNPVLHPAQGSGSPLPRRGRQLQGRPEPNDYQDETAQDSPFRRKQNTRDILPRFGSASSGTWVPTAMLRSLREEDGGSEPISPAAAVASAGPSNLERRAAQRSGLSSPAGSPKGSLTAPAGSPTPSPGSQSRPVKKETYNSNPASTRPRTPPRLQAPTESSKAKEHGSSAEAPTRLRTPQGSLQAPVRPRTPPRSLEAPVRPRGGSAEVPAGSPTLLRQGLRTASKNTTESAQPNAVLMDRRHRALRSTPGGAGGASPEPSPQLESWKRGSRSPTEKTITTHISE